MELGEVDLGLGPALIPPIIKLVLVDTLVFIVMGITEVHICLTPETFLHTTIVD